MRKIKMSLNRSSAKSRKALYFRLGIAIFVLVVIGARRSMIVINQGASITPVSSVIKRNAEEKTISLRSLDHAIDLAAQYLTGVCDEKGKFRYRINLNPKAKVKEQYNLLRHAGAIYALGMYESIRPSDAIRSTMEKAIRFLRDVAVGPVEDQPGMLAVWSDPELTGEDDARTAKLGGAGLGLIALLSMEGITPGLTPIAELRQFGNFICFMQNEDGSFCSRYVPTKGGKDNSWNSLYYPGEAALGLIMLYEKDKDPVWLNAAANAIARLAIVRDGEKNIEHDHWALLATAKLIPYYERSHRPVSIDAILKHAFRICESIVGARPKFSEFSIRQGSLFSDGRTTPTSIRLEGLLAILPFVPDEEVLLKSRMMTVIKDGISFLIRSQVRTGPFAGAIPYTICPSSKEGQPLFDEIAKSKDTEVQIDDVQHALSALIQYREFVSPGKTDLMKENK